MQTLTANEAALVDWIQEHKVTWELTPWSEMVDHQPVTVGFELRLLARHVPHSHPSRAAASACASTNACGDVAEAAFPREQRPTSYEIDPLGGVAGGAIGATSEQAPPSKQRDQLSVPQTPEEHLARAAAYREKAASYRQVANSHRKMFSDYQAKNATPHQSKTGHEYPWIAKMRKHCDSYIKEAERLAAEAERFAEFHRMRGEEMKGK